MLADVDLANPSARHQLYQKSQKYCGTVQGKAPTDHSSMESVNIPLPLPALNGDQVCTLYQYLQFNGGFSMIPTKEDGDCLVHLGEGLIYQQKWEMCMLEGCC